MATNPDRFIGFHQWIHIMEALRREHPDIVTVDDFGQSEGGFPIRQYCFGDGKIVHKRVSSVHGNETRSMVTDICEALYWCANPAELKRRNVRIEISLPDPDAIVANHPWILEGRPSLASYMKWSFRDATLARQVEFALLAPEQIDSRGIGGRHHGANTLSEDRPLHYWNSHYLGSLVTGHNAHLSDGCYFMLGDTVPVLLPEELAERLIAAADRRGVPVTSISAEPSLDGSSPWYPYVTAENSAALGRGFSNGEDSLYRYFESNARPAHWLYGRDPDVFGRKVSPAPGRDVRNPVR